MSIIISAKLSKNKTKTRYTFEWGKAADQRMASGIFTYNKPQNIIEKNHNKEAILILESKRSRMILDKQSIYTSYIPSHKIKTNFLDYYAEYVKSNFRNNSRHLSCSYSHFKTFLKTDFISAKGITQNLCENYSAYLLIQQLKLYSHDHQWNYNPKHRKLENLHQKKNLRFCWYFPF